jgi:hypothetical protein
VNEALDDLEALRELLLDLLRFRRAHLLLQLGTVASMSVFTRASRTASAPILATKESSPYSSSAWRYSVSVRSCFISSGVLPGSMTM